MSTVADHLPQYSLSFDGASSMGITNANQPTWGDTHSFTLRFKRTNTSTEEYLFSKGADSDPVTGFKCEILATGTIYFIVGITTAGFPSFLASNVFISTTTVNDTNWHELLIVMKCNDGTASERLKMWLDGNAETASTSVLSQGTYNGNTSRFWWGCSVAVNKYFTGLMYNMGVTASGTSFLNTDVRETDGTAKDFKSISLAFFPYVDAGSVTSDWALGTTWANSGLTASSTLGDAAT